MSDIRSPMRARVRTRLRTIIPATMLAGALAFGLGACTSTGAQSGADLRSSVVQIADRSASGDYAGALAELAQLDRRVTAASEGGSLDAEQEQAIREAMDLVHADLLAAEIATTPTPTPTPTPDPDDANDDDNSGPGNSDDKGRDDKGNDNKGNDDD